MKKNLKRWLIISVVALFILMFLLTSKPDKYQLMDNLDYNITLNKDGSMNVIETWDVYVENTSTLFRTFNKDNKFGEIENVQVKDLETGKNLNQINGAMYYVTNGCYYALYTSLYEFEVAWGIGMQHQKGRKKYQFSYTVKDVVTNYKDCQEIYWKLLSADNGIPVKKVTGTVKLPSNVKDIDNLKVWGHGPLNGKIERASNDTIKFNIKNLDVKKMLEIRVVITENLFEVTSTKDRNYSYLDTILKEENYWAKDADNDTKVLYMILLVLYIIIIIINIFKILKYYKVHKKANDGIVHTNLKYYREIPRENENTPAQAAYLYYFKKDNNDMRPYQSNIIAATILDLALKKYISLRNEKNKVFVKILKSEESKLSKDELAVYKILKETNKDKEELNITEIRTFAKEKYNRYDTLVNQLANSSRENLYKQKLVDKLKKEEYNKSKIAKIKLWILKIFVEFVIILLLFGLLIPVINIICINLFGIGYRENFGVLSLFIVPILITIFVKNKLLLKIKNKIAVLTQKGTEEQEQLKGLANYMKDFSMIDEKEVPSLAVWEKYLVYATAFGIADKAIKQMQAKYPKVFVKEYWEDENNALNYSIIRFTTNDIIFDNNIYRNPIDTISTNINNASRISLSEIASHSSSYGSRK